MAQEDKEQKVAAAKALQAEVQAFASQLGLAAAGGSFGGFDDSDFRPVAAKKKISEGNKRQKVAPAAPAPAEQQQQQRQPAPQPAAKRARGSQGVLSKHLAVQAKQQAEAAAKQEDRKGRDWNIGVGPRPGTCSAIGCRWSLLSTRALRPARRSALVSALCHR
jgi:hypothetical protein